MTITHLKDLAAEARHAPVKTVIAVVEAHDLHTLEAVVRAAADGLMIPVLIGNTDEIAAILSSLGTDPAAYDLVASGSADESLATAVTLINTGRASAIMKGMLDSGQFIKAIIRKENGLTNGGHLSVAGFFELPSYPKLLAVSDMAINTYPDLAGKKAIVENAVHMLHTLGFNRPKVAVLSSVEKPNPKMPDAVDGNALKEMNQNGEITGCDIDGPISFDLATSAEAARIKGYDSAVAGNADLLIVPDIVSGNILAKCLTGFSDAVTAGTVLGATIPVILTSRSAEPSDKYYSIALAACLAARGR